MSNSYDDFFDNICNTCQGAGDFDGCFCTRCSGAGYAVLDEQDKDICYTEAEWEYYVESTGGNDPYKDLVS